MWFPFQFRREGDGGCAFDAAHHPHDAAQREPYAAEVRSA
jgi:hypothetical protein